MPDIELVNLKNLKESLHKFLFNNIFTPLNIDITTDRAIEFHPHSDKKWIDFAFHDNDLGTFQIQDVRFVLATRNDPDGDELIDLRDILLGCLTNPAVDGGSRTRYMVLYNTSNPDSLEQIGNMWFSRLDQSPIDIARDQTKYMIIDGLLHSETR